jgi:small subunit ribosomal protein S17
MPRKKAEVTEQKDDDTLIEKVADVVEAAGDKAGEVISAVGEKVGDVVAPVAEAVGEAVAPVTKRAGKAASAVGDAVGGAVAAVTGGNGTEAEDEQEAQNENEAESEALLTTISKGAATTTGTSLPEYLRNRRTEIGRVVSNKMQKTVVVSVERSKPHPLYKKVVRQTVKFMAHDELNSGMGDTVRIIESRPMSRHKRWRVVEIVQKAERL